MVTFYVWNLSNSYTLGNITRIKYEVFTRGSESTLVPVICWYWRTFEGDRQCGSHLCYKGSNILETVQDRDIATTDD